MENKRLTNEELRAIRERVEKATVVNWYGRYGFENEAYVHDNEGETVAENLNDRDATFIAHARQDIPRLHAEIGRLRNEIVRLRGITHLSCPNCIEDCAAWVGHGVPCGKDW